MVGRIDDDDDAEDIVEEDVGDEEPDDGEDLLGDDMMRDYQPEPELDRYSATGLDDEGDFEALSPEARRAADRVIEQRQAAKRQRIEEEQNTRKRSRAGHLLDDDDDNDADNAGAGDGSGGRDSPASSPSIHIPDPDADGGGSGDDGGDDGDDGDGGDGGDGQGGGGRRRRSRSGSTDGTQDPTTLSMTDLADISDVKGPLSEWVVKERVRQGIKARFLNFLLTARNKAYRLKITEMVNKGRHSLEVSFIHLSEAFDALLAIWVSDAPAEVLEIFDEAATDLTRREFPQFEAVCHAHTVHVRIAELPICDPIRDVRQAHLNALIKVAGVVTRRSVVFPQLLRVVFDCLVCGFAIGPIVQRGEKEIKPHACPQCQQRNAFKVNYTATIFRNYQIVSLQESPGQVPPGRLPRSIEVVLLDDLIDSTKPGEEVEVTGIYRNNFDPLLNHQHGFPVFATNLEANYVERKTSSQQSHRLTEEDKEKILQLSKDPRLAVKMVNSIAPSIHGHEDVKLGLLLCLLGGQEKEAGEPGQHRIRGDINCLLLGDPGTAKSQFLKYIEKTAHRAVFTTGRGSTAVGLTAAVHSDRQSGEWTLEGGALVIADRGVCMIDEFDKMSDQDRTSIHEAMEQQTISICKAGIVTTLQARCSVLAAANPIGGIYDEALTFEQNVDLTQPILQRFDLLFVMRDAVDVSRDTELAEFVCQSHTRSHPLIMQKEHDRRAELGEEAEEEELRAKDQITQDLVRKYIRYARAHVRPTISQIDENRLSHLYGELRRESGFGGGVTMSVRHIESIIRLTEAHARLHLREYAREDDVNTAVRLFLNCFINTHKFQGKRVLREKFARYLQQEDDQEQLLSFLLRSLVKHLVDYETRTRGRYESVDVRVPLRDLEEKAHEYEIHDLAAFLRSPAFRKEYTLDRPRREIVRSFRTD